MPILNKFTDTIFLKEDSELRDKVEQLKKFQNELKQKEIKLDPATKLKFDQDLRYSQYGLIGEDRIAYELKNANLGMYVMRDVCISYNGQAAQIDYVIVTRSNCYFVECKNMIGTVTVNREGEFRREFTWRNNKYKEAMYSPYRQALRHIETFKKIWQKQRSKIIVALCNNGFDKYYKPLVIMANPKGMLNIEYAPKDIKNATIRVDQLIEYLKKDLKSFDRKKLPFDTITNTFNEKQQDLYEFAMGVLVQHKKKFIDYTKEYRNTLHKETKSKNANDVDIRLKERLIAYRSQIARKNKVPAYCVLKNDEIERLIEKRPRTINELAKILSQVKISKYGKVILGIINQ